MFERKKYKKFAKTQLTGRWTVPVLITLVIGIITILFSIPETNALLRSGYFEAIAAQDIDMLISAAEEIQKSSTTNFVTSIVQMIVSAILSVAALNVYITMSRSPEPVKFGKFIEGFNSWLRATLGILWEFLWIFLWTLLFVIPGIIKAYAYSQTLFIIAEYKNVSVTKALNISKIITKGHKWDIFVMYLSFIGWDILCLFTLGIGNLWLTPYKTMTYTNAFHAMLKEAVESGKIMPEDLSE